MKKSARFHISAQNIDCGYLLEPPRQGGFNKYQQSMFLAEIRKLMYNPVNPFYCIKVGFKGVKIILACFHDGGWIIWPEQAKRAINIYFKQIVHIIYPREFQLYKADPSDTKTPFLDLILLILMV